MSKAKKKDNVIVLGSDAFAKIAAKFKSHEERPYDIRSADIKDDLCYYSFEQLSGWNKGETHKITTPPPLIITDDLRNAIASFNVHMACIDDVFKHAGVEFDDINSLKNHELTFLYTTTGFKITGSDENLGVIIYGHKLVTGNDRIKVECPRRMLDNSSSYKWYNELRAVVENACLEVSLYREGKGTPVSVPEDEEDKKQGKIPFGEEGFTVTAELHSAIDDEFSNARQ